MKPVGAAAEESVLRLEADEWSLAEPPALETLTPPPLASSEIQELLGANALFVREGGASGAVLAGNEDPWSLMVHRGISSRPYKEVAKELEQAGLWVSRDLPRFDVAPIVDGKKSLLSLGEGRSAFISTILERREARLSGESRTLPPVMAVDLTYDQTLATAFKMEHIDPSTRWPPGIAGHYNGAIYQDLDLRDERGHRIQFDTIVSSWSLAQVVNNATDAQAELILGRVIDHLAPGGALFLSGWMGLSMTKVGGFLKSLQERGVIKAYDTDAARVIQR